MAVYYGVASRGIFIYYKNRTRSTKKYKSIKKTK